MLRSKKVAVGFSQTLFRDNGPALDVKEVRRASDSRALKAYLGQSRLHMMERRGGGGLFIKAMDIG